MSLENLIGKPDSNLAVKPFIALLLENMLGKMTTAQVIAAINTMIPAPLTIDDEKDVAEIIKRLNAASNKMEFIYGIYFAFCLAEYSPATMTKVELKTRYGLR